ncbi:hypothetical protein [Cloacibacillus evryensis]|uniref:hypothetical protein n=1 Tax=Cloacibacillus evryensis TaxID=508460 RepID=UPI00044AE215|nr:hypothetical protein [Cloacibacillus evryensis]EXG78109.1 hypothetical protein Cloev_0214 [Cloacibacillus evryensis DSM 19522]MEA5033883.1 hypothetical protein [Cloacibacillus evryensis]
MHIIMLLAKYPALNLMSAPPSSNMGNIVVMIRAIVNPVLHAAQGSGIYFLCG